MCHLFIMPDNTVIKDDEGDLENWLVENGYTPREHWALCHDYCLCGLASEVAELIECDLEVENMGVPEDEWKGEERKQKVWFHRLPEVRLQIGNQS